MISYHNNTNPNLNPITEISPAVGGDSHLFFSVTFSLQRNYEFISCDSVRHTINFYFLSIEHCTVYFCVLNYNVP